MTKQQEQKAKPTEQNQVQGEGNYEAGRHYNEATRDFVESGKVDDAARKAAPKSSAEADELRRAEDAGRSRAREEDPSVHRDGEATDIERE